MSCSLRVGKTVPPTININGDVVDQNIYRTVQVRSGIMQAMLRCIKTVRPRSVYMAGDYITALNFQLLLLLSGLVLLNIYSFQNKTEGKTCIETQKKEKESKTSNLYLFIYLFYINIAITKFPLAENIKLIKKSSCLVSITTLLLKLTSCLNSAKM